MPNIDPLADLGLDTGSASSTTDTLDLGAEAVKEDNTVVKSAQTAPEPATEEDDGSAYEIGEIEIGAVAEVPALTRTGGGGRSKYPFDKLAAPAPGAIAQFTVPYAGGDEGKFKRSVQSATTQANRAAKEAGKPNYYESRTVTKDDKFFGVAVYRTDARPAKEEEENKTE